MSGELFVLRFVEGEAANLDLDAFSESTAGYVAGGGLSEDFLRVRFPDSTECEIVIGRDGGALASLLVKRFEQGAGSDFLLDLLTSQRAMLLPPSGVAVLPFEGLIEELPSELRETAVVVSSPSELELAIVGSGDS